ncbi:MAG: THUMP domain-containing protein [Candidatus Bathyarchaeota archaeon]|jgi:tRNA(Ser,Leu) C12 N-acetylase TAN1
MDEFNLLVSCSWGAYGRAKEEILHILRVLDDENPFVKRTVAKGIIGVKTSLEPRDVVHKLRRMFNKDPFIFQQTTKWVPVDLWTHSDLDSMRNAVKVLRNEIRAGEKWRMTMEKRRYTRYHKMEIITALAELIDEKVDLETPDKILRVDIIGRYTGFSVLTPQDIFSVSKPLLDGDGVE